jgi:hypothetical protein
MTEKPSGQGVAGRTKSHFVIAMHALMVIDLINHHSLKQALMTIKVVINDIIIVIISRESR